MARQDDYVRYTIRVPAELYERLKDKAGDKSVNAEIIERLEQSFAGGAGDIQLVEKIDQLTRALTEVQGFEDRRLEVLGDLSRIVDDVNAVIRAVEEEAAGGHPHVTMLTPLGQMLLSALDLRTELAMRTVLKALQEAGFSLEKYQAVEMAVPTFSLEKRMLRQ